MVLILTPALSACASSSSIDLQFDHLIPGNFPINRRLLSQRTPGAIVEEQGWTRGDYGIAVLHSESSKLSLIVGYEFEFDEAKVVVEETEQGVAIVHRFGTLAELKPGQEIECGSQVLRVATGDESECMRQLAVFSERLNNDHPQTSLNILRSA